MLTIPLLPVPSQTMDVVLGGQSCSVSLVQRGQSLFLDLSVEGRYILASVLCRDRVRLVRAAYLGFAGDLAMMDTEGKADPQYSGLGARWQLVYLAPGELS